MYSQTKPDQTKNMKDKYKRKQERQVITKVNNTNDDIVVIDLNNKYE